MRLAETVDSKCADKPQSKDAVAYFRQKGYAITFDWYEMLGEAHIRAFTVAKAAKHEVLKTIYEAQKKGFDRRHHRATVY